MTGLLFRATGAAAVDGWAAASLGGAFYNRPAVCRLFSFAGLALIAPALYLAWRAGGAP